MDITIVLKVTCIMGYGLRLGIQEQRMECQKWRECYILGNFTKHSWECCQILQAMMPNMPGNVTKHSCKVWQTFWGGLPSTLGYVLKHSGEYPHVFWRILPNILGNVGSETFQRMSLDTPTNALKHSRECQ